MRLTELQLDDVRCLAHAELTLSPGLNLITGDNGAGKTSVLEALHLLGYGRSFRGRVRDGLIRFGQDQLRVFARWTNSGGRVFAGGLEHSGDRWRARINSIDSESLSDFCAQFAVVSFEPGSHELISGPADGRRRFLDWSLFHVEPSFLPLWRRYARGLKQRNSVLKQNPGASAQLEAFEFEMAEAGEQLSTLRLIGLRDLEQHFQSFASQLLPELGVGTLEFMPGWKRDSVGLRDSLILTRQRDGLLGYTHQGPHRADWRLGYTELQRADVMSRGQEKLSALALVLAQAAWYADVHQEWPLVCLDDLVSELDPRHFLKALDLVSGVGAQTLVSATHWPSEAPPADVMFHVERGVVAPQDAAFKA